MLTKFQKASLTVRVTLFASSALFPAATPLFAQSAQVHILPPGTIRNRLDQYKGSDKTRGATLLKSFAEAGCPVQSLQEQLVKGRKEPNDICTLPGKTDRVLLVGAHFDHVLQGSGVVDNWSGASLLPSLFESLAKEERNHTLVFIGFTGEEDGELGSSFYVNQLSKGELSRIDLMLTIDSIGMGPTKVWVSRSDPSAVRLLAGVSHSLKLPIAEMNLDGFGESDEEPFFKHKVRTIVIHSLDPENKGVLHSARDNFSAISFKDYIDTYQLLAGYLAVANVRLRPESPTDSASTN